jgi:23S rRNA pseudouridine2605 synthase
MRINKFLVAAGAAPSRRAAEGLIFNSQVKVQRADGTKLAPADVIGAQIDPQTDKVYVDGKLLSYRPARFIYLMLNKPAGYICTRRDIHADKTVFDLLPKKYETAGLFTVGRLDKESEGLLLFTNDGDWANRLLHPRWQKEKEYLVLVAAQSPLTPEKLGRLTAGLALGGKTYKMKSVQPVAGEIDSAANKRWQQWYRVILTTGYKRQIRVMFEKIGGEVRKLLRVRVGEQELGNLPTGQFREISKF